MAKSSKGQSWSCLEQGVIQGNNDYFKPYKPIFRLLTSSVIHSFLYRGDQASSANSPSDRQLLQGATGQLLPANILTAVGDTKHLDRPDWSKRQEKTYCTLLSFILLQDLLCWLRTPSPCKSWYQFCTLGIWQWENTAFTGASTNMHCWLPGQPFVFISVLLSKQSHEDWKIIGALPTDVWYQMYDMKWVLILCFP